MSAEGGLDRYVDSRSVVDQVEVFERLPRGSTFQRIGVWVIDELERVHLIAERNQSHLGRLMDRGISRRDPSAGNVLPDEGSAFLDALVEHFQAASYYAVRRTPLVRPPPDASGPLVEALYRVSRLILESRDLSAELMPVDKALAASVESSSQKLELARAQIWSRMTDGVA